MKIVPVSEIPLSKPVPENFDLNKLWAITEEMAQVCLKEDGIGLHSCQTGGEYDLFIVNQKATIPSMKEDKFYRYFNCSYEPDFNGVDFKDGTDLKIQVKSTEGCLSLNTPTEKRYFEVMRHRRVIVKGKILKQNPFSGKITASDVSGDWEGLAGIVFQHEIDHGKGVLISDIGMEVHIYG